MTSETSHMGADPRLCRNCRQPVVQKGKRPKEFCTNRCRAAYRDEQQQQAIREAMARIEQMRAGLDEMAAGLVTQAEAFSGAMEQFQASMNGAADLLRRFEKKKRTGPRA